MGRMRLSELSDAEGINPTMISRVIADLAEAGLVERVSDPRRPPSRLVEITETGNKLAERIRRERTDALNLALDGLDEQERGTSRPLPALERLAEQLKESGLDAGNPRRPRDLRRTLGSELPPLLQRPGDLADRHLDADDGSGLAGAEPHSLEHDARHIVAFQTLPVLLLGPYGGVVADRVDKLKLMIALQSAMGVQALILGVLTVTGVVHVWEIAVLAALLGLNNAFENPARQSFMLEMVGPEHLRNAVSLNSVLVNTARVIGPAVAGILIATVGEASASW